MESFYDYCDENLQLVTFQLGIEEYALPILSVQEIIQYQEPRQLPSMPSYVMGMISLRGSVIPVLNTGERLHVNTNDSATTDKKIIILQADADCIGLVVDSVSEVIYLPKAEIEAVPLNNDSDVNCIYGVGKYQDKLIVLIEPDKFIYDSSVQEVNKKEKVASETEI